MSFLSVHSVRYSSRRLCFQHSPVIIPLNLTVLFRSLSLHHTSFIQSYSLSLCPCLTFSPALSLRLPLPSPRHLPSHLETIRLQHCSMRVKWSQGVAKEWCSDYASHRDFFPTQRKENQVEFSFTFDLSQYSQTSFLPPMYTTKAESTYTTKAKTKNATSMSHINTP